MVIKLDIIAGARPNFIKIAPLIHAIDFYNAKGKGKLAYRLIHTGQHYDQKMSETFFEQLGIPNPNFNLGVGSGSQAEQTAGIMLGYEKVLLQNRPDLTIVVGDVTSTMACSIVAKKLHVKVVHIEAGIRSGDIKMPEEINRILTDSITDFFFTTTKSASEELLRTGHNKSNIFFVGNIMIDTLQKNLNRLIKPKSLNSKIGKNSYIVLTMHRPSNVDDADNLREILEKILENANGHKVVFPVHPRTKRILEELKLESELLIYLDPLPYLEFIYLIKESNGVITDSGGVTEETTVLGIPCMTLRNSTERPETVSIGTNELVGTNLSDISNATNKMTSGKWKKGKIPELWDGNTAPRIVEHILKLDLMG